MQQERYELIEDQFWLIDEELGIDLSSTVDDKEVQSYQEGFPRSICYRKKGELHGPSTYYSKTSQLLSVTWYYLGEKVGKVLRHYPNGSLYSVERFVDGERHLRQDYYYLDQTLKASTGYQFGKLDGVTRLFWPDGKLKREAYFKEGQLQGEEKFFDEEGRSIGKMAAALS